MAIESALLEVVKHLSTAAAHSEEDKQDKKWNERRAKDEAAARVDAKMATRNWEDEDEVKKNYRPPTPPRYPVEDSGSKRRKERSKLGRRTNKENANWQERGASGSIIESSVGGSERTVDSYDDIDGYYEDPSVFDGRGEHRR